MSGNPPNDLMADFLKLRAEATERSFADTVGSSMNYKLLRELRAVRREMEKRDDEKERQMREMREELCEIRREMRENREILQSFREMQLEMTKIEVKTTKLPSIVDEIIGEWYSEEDHIYWKYERKDNMIMEFLRNKDGTYDDCVTSRILISKALDNNQLKFESTHFNFALSIQNGQLHRSFRNSGTLAIIAGSVIYERIQ